MLFEIICTNGIATGFKNVPFTPPGSKFHYTTHGWTLVSAVIESVTGKPFLDYMRDNILRPLGMTKTMPELHDKIIYGRARQVFQTSYTKQSKISQLQ